MENRRKVGPREIPPVGTKVVTLRELRSAHDPGVQPKGAVGVIIKTPTDAEHSFRVRLVNGVEVNLRREGFAILSEVQREGIRAGSAEVAGFDLDAAIIYRCVVGSRAYGLDNETSDLDRRGIYLPTAEAEWSLYGVPEQLENEATQECYWELQKFLVLALKANPNILECLYTPVVEQVQPLGEELLSMRAEFVTKLIYQTFNGYVISQFKKLGQDMRNHGHVKWKHAMHLIRLLLAGKEALQTGEIPVRVERNREALLAIRDGMMAWDEVERWRKALHQEFDDAFGASRLPERPNYGHVNAYLIKARRSMV